MFKAGTAKTLKIVISMVISMVVGSWLGIKEYYFNVKGSLSWSHHRLFSSENHVMARILKMVFANNIYFYVYLYMTGVSLGMTGFVLKKIDLP